ncbi:bestrophin family ion channel [Fluviicola taffensis]|uniref:bestrophin family protein n=1 Tax=Fluviicola taffensis TaxID=191579 RepID=UPI003137903A
MYTEFINPTRAALSFSRNQIIVYVVWSAIVVCTYHFSKWELISIPFLPVSLIGTALAFFLGFKSNASYDRLYEARKNYGSIVNDSRAWAIMLNAYITNHANKNISKEEIQEIKEDLVNRHIAWMYAHKFYLRHRRQPWERDAKYHNVFRGKLQEEFNIETDLEQNLLRYLSQEEVSAVIRSANPATQLLNNQGKRLAEIREANLIEDFRLIEFQNQINKLLDDQGKNERIKNFPYPLQFSFMLRISLRIFSFLLPFALITELNKQGENFMWLTIPFSAIINWIFYFSERNSEYSENPFQGLIYDVPITNITRTIEIDMLQAIGVEDVPEPILAKNGILM